MSNTNSGGGFPLFAVLGIVFIVLKLTGVVAWSWLWVLAPFWGPLAVTLLIALVALPFVIKKAKSSRSKVETYFDSLSPNRFN